MNMKNIFAVIIPALLCAACENPVVQDLLRVPATATAIHINAETLDGSVYKPAGEINYGLEPAFNPERTEYTALVPETTDRITVTGAPYKDGTVQYREEGGPVLNTGVFDFTGKQSALVYVTVNRKYMDTAVYTILVKRKQPAWLNGIEVTSDVTGATPQPLSRGFDPDDTRPYTVVVPSTAAKVQVTGAVKPGVEISFSQDGGAFFPDPPLAEPGDTPPFSSGERSFPAGADQTAVAIRVFLPPSPANSDPSPVVYTLLIKRPGKITPFAGQVNNFFLGESPAEHHYYSEGEAVAFTVKPPFGYTTAGVRYIPEGGGAVTIIPQGNVYAFVMPRGNVTLRGEWAPIPSVPNALYVRGIRDGETAEDILAEKAVNGNGDDGSSWANASMNLQDVMDTKWAAGKEIWVSAGRVRPDWTRVTPGSGWASALSAAQLDNKRAWSFVLRDGVHIYGGFEGTETTRPSVLPQNKTILSGDRGTDGNAFRVLVAVSINNPTLVESLTISGGSNIYGVSSLTVQGKTITGGWGGGVYTNSCGRNLKFRNVTITGNMASNGGGMYNYQSGPTLEGAAITANTATSNGGGMYNNLSSPFLTGWTSVSGNDAQSYGGMYNSGGSLELENVRINNNTSTQGTGGVYNTGSTFTATNVEINGNRSYTARAGGVENSQSIFTGTNIVISGNRSATGLAGGMHNNKSHVVLTNARITGNETGSSTLAGPMTIGSAGGICNEYGVNPADNYYITLTNVEISGNKSNGAAGGFYARGVHVTLINVTISGNAAGPAGGWGIYLHQSKPFDIRNSIIWGNGAAGQNIKWYASSDSGNIQYANTLVERPSGDNGGGIVTGGYNALVPLTPEDLSFSGSAADIFTGPLPSSTPSVAPLGAYQLKSPDIWINAGGNPDSFYGAVPGLPNVAPGTSSPQAPATGPGPEEDCAGNARYNTAIDLGAYEKQ